MGIQNYWRTGLTDVYTPREEMGLRRVGSFLILPASAHSLTPTLKLICSLLTFFLEKITHKLIDQSKRFGSGRELSDFRESGTNQVTRHSRR